MFARVPRSITSACELKTAMTRAQARGLLQRTQRGSHFFFFFFRTTIAIEPLSLFTAPETPDTIIVLCPYKYLFTNKVVDVDCP